MSSQKKYAPTLFGFPANMTGNPGGGSIALSGPPDTSAFGKHYYMCFIPDSDRVVTAFRAFFTIMTGSLGANDVRAEIQADSGSGAPSGTALVTTTTWSNAWSGSYFWNEASFAATGVSGGQMYWMVVKNIHATPTDNYPTINNASPSFPLMYPGQASTFAPKSAYYLGAYTYQSNQGMRITYTDGYEGAPCWNYGADTTNKIYGGRSNGSKVTLPGQCVYNVIGVGMPIIKQGSPTGSIKFAIYDNTPTVLATTPGRDIHLYTGGAWIWDFFSSPLQLTGGSTYRVQGLNSATDSATNYYAAYLCKWDTDANSLPLMPLNGNIIQIFFNGSTWTEGSSGFIVPFVLLLDPEEPYSAPTVTVGGVWSMT